MARSKRTDDVFDLPARQVQRATTHRSLWAVRLPPPGRRVGRWKRRGDDVDESPDLGRFTDHSGRCPETVHEAAASRRRLGGRERPLPSSALRGLWTAIGPDKVAPTTLTLVLVLSTWWTIIPNTCKAPQISIKRRRRHGCEGVARLELTERVRRVAHLRNLLEPAAGGRGVAETAGESTRATSSTPSARPGWPPCGAQVSGTLCPCALRCLSYPLADLSHACHRPRVQEMVSEASWHLFY